MTDVERRYLAYGLTIDSTIALDLQPGPAGGAADVILRREPLPHIGAPRYPERASLFAGGTAARLAVRLPGVAAGEVRGGSEIAVEPEPSLSPAALGGFVLQPMLAYLLIQRGHLVLHASCVEIGGHAIVILGPSGAGKSTTAAAITARGHRLITDDVLAVTDDGSVLPGVARLKLWPAAAVALGHDPEALDACAGEPSKRAYRPPADGVEPGPVKLCRVFVLADGEEPALEPLGAAEALPLLIVNSYGILAIHDTGEAAHFARVTGLLGRVPVLRLRRPRALDRLAELSGLIESDLARSAPSPAGAHRS